MDIKDYLNDELKRLNRKEGEKSARTSSVLSVSILIFVRKEIRRWR